MAANSTWRQRGLKAPRSDYSTELRGGDIERRQSRTGRTQTKTAGVLRRALLSRPFLPRRSSHVREPVQVYLAPDDSALLNRLAEETGLSKAEILAESSAGPWPSDVVVNHDAVLAESYVASPKKRR